MQPSDFSFRKGEGCIFYKNKMKLDIINPTFSRIWMIVAISSKRAFHIRRSTMRNFCLNFFDRIPSTGTLIGRGSIRIANIMGLIDKFGEALFDRDAFFELSHNFTLGVVKIG
jgi:hypothetical protein